MDTPKVGEIWLVRGFGKFPTTQTIVEYDEEWEIVTVSVINHWGNHKYYHTTNIPHFLTTCIRKLK